MGIKSIVTPIDNSVLCEQRTDFAILAARQQNARLTGIVSSGIDTSLLVGDLLAPGSALIDKLQSIADTEAHNAIEKFNDRCAHYKPHLTHISPGTSVDAINSEASVNDLIVLTQYLESAGSEMRDKGLIEHTLMTSSTPVLVIPALGTYDSLPGKILIGWADTRECSRAIRASLPFLQHAETVDIVAVNAEKKTDTSEKQKKLLAYLALHNVKAKFTAENSTLDPANFLLSHACDIGAQMLVMGAYGHARLRQWAMGGSTRTILETMTLPVFLVH